MAKKSLRTLYEQTRRASQKFHNLKRKLDNGIEDRWGFHYSDVDMDEIIDTIDYATGAEDFDSFVELMNKEIKKREAKGEKD